MYLKLNGKLTEMTVEPVSEQELMTYFESLCKSAKANPWRGIEFSQAKNVLRELAHSPHYDELKQTLAELHTYRKAYVQNPVNKPLPKNYVEAMARRLR